MIIVFLSIGIICLVFGLICIPLHKERAANNCIILGCMITLLFSFLFAVAMSGLIKADETLPKQIEIYEEENKEIEKQIETYIKAYDDKYTNFDFEKDDINGLIAAIPSLGSSNLISKQIETYNDNKKEIKKLKSEQVEYSTWKFWLYFGN